MVVAFRCHGCGFWMSRSAHSGGSCEPSSKEEFEFKKVLKKILDFCQKLMYDQKNVLVLHFGQISLTSTIFFGDYLNLHLRTQCSYFIFFDLKYVEIKNIMPVRFQES